MKEEIWPTNNRSVISDDAWISVLVQKRAKHLNRKLVSAQMSTGTSRILGGAALPTADTGLQYAVGHGATVFGWQAHLDHCGGQPGVSDEEIIARLDAQIAALKKQYPGRHFRIVASNTVIDIQEV